MVHAVICSLSQRWPSFAPRGVGMEFVVKTVLIYYVSVLRVHLPIVMSPRQCFFSVSLEKNNSPFRRQALPTIIQRTPSA
jgi:hypothetical protein